MPLSSDGRRPSPGTRVRRPASPIPQSTRSARAGSCGSAPPCRSTPPRTPSAPSGRHYRDRGCPVHGSLVAVARGASRDRIVGRGRPLSRRFGGDDLCPSCGGWTRRGPRAETSRVDEVGSGRRVAIDEQGRAVAAGQIRQGDHCGSSPVREPPVATWALNLACLPWVVGHHGDSLGMWHAVTVGYGGYARR